MYAPIVLLAFNRPGHLQRTVDALAANTLAAASDLYVFCDGPRHEQDEPLVAAVRKVCSGIKGFKNILVTHRENNLGCGKGVVSGISAVFASHERAIIIEDDIVCSPHALSYFNAGLATYDDEKTVFAISGWTFPPSMLPLPNDYPYDAYFTPRFAGWGWAGWRDRWNAIDFDVTDYAEFCSNPYMQESFEARGADLISMLHAQLHGRIDAWDIQMEYTGFKHGCVYLAPVHSYTTNIGMGSGTHTLNFTTKYDNDVSKAVPSPRLPDSIFVVPRFAQARYALSVSKRTPITKKLVRKGIKFFKSILQ